MSVWKSVDETFAGRRGTVFDVRGPREYTRTFEVVTNDKSLASIAVCDAPGIPRPYTSYASGNGLEYDFLALCVRIQAEQDAKDWSLWKVTAEYSTEMPEGGPVDEADYGSPGGMQGYSSDGVPYSGLPEGGVGGDGGSGGDPTAGSQNNPETEPPDVEWDFEVVNAVPPKDLDGKAFLNSARQPFSPPYTDEEAYAVLSLTRNERGFDRKKATDYAFALNSDVFLGAEPETVQCMPPKARMMYKGSLQYWRVTYRLRFLSAIDGGPTTFQPQILDAGLCKLQKNEAAPAFNKPVPIIRNGHPISQPVLLDGQGDEQQPDGQGLIPPHWLSFRRRRVLPFASLISRGLA